jgi:chromosome segregation ATPase
MKSMIGVIILAVLALGLTIALVTTKRQASVEKQKDVESIVSHSNQVVKLNADLIEQRQVNVLLSNDVNVVRADLGSVSNKLVDTTVALTKSEDALKESKQEIARRDAKIADLEKQNQELDMRAADLSTAITNLTGEIGETQRRLAASEGDKSFLEKELKRLMAEKAELERQFNDLAVVRAQVAKLREELNVSRRLEWIRKGLFAADEQKGAQKLLQKGPLASAANTNRYDLNVEVNADGSVRVIPPATNAPATSSK